MNEPQFLHKNLIITSDKQRSSQGTVFYFKFNASSQFSDGEVSVESILKIVKKFLTFLYVISILQTSKKLMTKRREY
jgi:hypothetical protein